MKPPTEAAAIPATPITQAEGTATVSSAERLAGVRRREREPARAAAREGRRADLFLAVQERGAVGSSPWIGSTVVRGGVAVRRPG